MVMAGNDAGKPKPSQLIALSIGFVMAILGILNTSPNVGPLPQVGPFNHELMRAGLFGMAVAAVLFKVSFASSLRKIKPVLFFPGLLLDVALFAAATYSFYDYFIVLEELDEGLFFFDEAHAYTALMGCAVILALCWRVWGFALAACGGVALLYFYTGHMWPGIFETAQVDFVSSTSEDLWYNAADGVLGTILGIVIGTIFPFILLGAVLEGTGGGGSMIRIAFNLFKNSKGGPAHAAILASSLFGSISGSAVANVVGTGVVTIPMIQKRGFSAAFSGGVEATASTGGQIMPPIMGAAALVMADFTGISYLTIIVAALIPALFYYGSLFIAVIFEARRLGVSAAAGEMEVHIDPPTKQDYMNLTLVVIPIGIIVAALLMGMSAAGSGIMALYSLIPLSFLLNPEVRKKPSQLVVALAKGGYNFAMLLMAVGVVGIIVGVLGSTGLPNDFAQMVSGATEGNLLGALFLAMMAALVLGMGMPTLPAYLTIIIIMGPSMLKLGLEPLVAHMFVFYFGVASAITPPVAMAAFAAASITQGSPIKTAVEATRIGLVIFVIPYAFAFYPELLLVPEALPEVNGQPAGVDVFAILSILVRLAMVVVMLSSAFAFFDKVKLSTAEVLVRIAIAVGLLIVSPVIHWAAMAAAIVVLILHRRKNGENCAEVVA